MKCKPTVSVFSMDGDFAPLPELSRIAKKNAAVLMVDDAHGLGVLGRRGEGCIGHFNLSEDELPILMGTFGKALGAGGAFIAAPPIFHNMLKQFAKSHMYTTAMPPAIAAAVLESLTLLTTEPEHREKLQHNIHYFTKCAKALDLPLLPSQTAIQPLLLNTPERTLHIAKQLQTAGFWVTPIRPPTVPPNTARLRITLNSHHTFEQIEALLTTIVEIFKKY